MPGAEWKKPETTNVCYGLLSRLGVTATRRSFTLYGRFSRGGFRFGKLTGQPTQSEQRADKRRILDADLRVGPIANSSHNGESQAVAA